MPNIHYDSWIARYKQPFGAIAKDQAVTFGITVASQTNPQVELLLRKDGEMSVTSYQMTYKEADFYQVTLSLEQAGLYYYYFKIELDENGQRACYFYGADYDGYGGPGRVSAGDNITAYQLTCYQTEVTAPKWYQGGVCYQIFPDRFYNGNPNQEITGKKKNSFIYATLEDTPYYIKDAKGEVVRWDFFGGNLKGIKAKIPYLKELGIRGLYLNPIFLATTNHRYDTNDFMEIDPMLGTSADFKDLLDELHRNGMYLILDGVFNHVGKDSKYFNARKLYYGADQGAAQDENSPYYSWFKFTHYPDEYASWWGVKDLPEVDKANPNYQAYIYGAKDSVISKWTNLGVDGWRLDVADELPEYFIEGIRKNLDGFANEKLLLGEVWEDASNKIAHEARRHYVEGSELDGVMNYPLRKCILDLLINSHQRPIWSVARELMSLRENYPRTFFFNALNNLGTHDTERILTALGNDERKLIAAYGLLFMFPGVPCIYYGDEAGLTGGKDPLNRAFFPWGRENLTIQKLVKKWVHRHNDSEALQKGELIIGGNDNCFIILRYTETKLAFYVLNLSQQTIDLGQESFAFDHDNHNLGETVVKQVATTQLQPFEGYFWQGNRS